MSITIEESILSIIKRGEFRHLLSRDELTFATVVQRDGPGFSKIDSLAHYVPKGYDASEFQLKPDSWLFEIIDIMRAKRTEINPENFLKEVEEYRNERLPSTYVAEINPVIFYKALLVRFPNHIGVLADMGQQPMLIPDKPEDLPEDLYKIYQKVEVQLTQHMMEKWWRDCGNDAKKIPALMKTLNSDVMMKKEMEKSKMKNKEAEKEDEKYSRTERPNWSR